MFVAGRLLPRVKRKGHTSGSEYSHVQKVVRAGGIALRVPAVENEEYGCAPGFDVTFLGVTGAESIEDIRLHAEIVAAQPED